MAAYSLVLLRFHEDRGDLWNRYLSRSVAGRGLGAVIGINENPSFADWVYFVVEHPTRPTTFKAVVGWERRRSGDRSTLTASAVSMRAEVFSPGTGLLRRSQHCVGAGRAPPVAPGTAPPGAGGARSALVDQLVDMFPKVAGGSSQQFGDAQGRRTPFHPGSSWKCTGRP
jgi:hypothetical protein